MAGEKQIKQDINFLEKPLWFPTVRGRQTVFEMTDELGYTYESTMGTPSKVDMLFLYFCLLESQQKNFSKKVNLTFYQILKGCDIKVTTEKKNRVIESLKRWKRVTITFHGTFYDKKKYNTVVFGILETAKISEDKKHVEITFNEDWLNTIKSSGFFKYISFSEMKHLRSSVAIRLYEILSKSFYKREIWTIDAHKLAEKIPMKEKYFSSIERRIRPAVNIINEKTNLNIEFKIQKKAQNKGLFIFRKTRKSMLEHMRSGQNGQRSDNESGSELPAQKDYDAEIEKLLQQLSAAERENIEHEFMDHIAGNPYLQKKHKQEGLANGSVQKTYYAFIQRRLKIESPN